MFTKVNGSTIRSMAKANILTLVLVRLMKDLGRKEKNMEKEKQFMLMMMFMKDNLHRASETVTEK